MFVLESGSVVAGRYRLEQQLGEGGMGVVWAATHSVTRRRVALKFLKDRSAGNDLRRAFVREARAACAVSHDGILPVHDVIESEDGEPALVMDLLKGEPLSHRLQRDKLSMDEAARLLLPVFAAVGAAHAAGVVHRDLKPDNIFLSDSGVRILDFGLAKATLIDIGTARSLGTRSGEVVGTPRYMSPEQAFAEKDVDYRSDIWSLGLVAYECLSGVLPTGSDSLGQILKTILSGNIAPLCSVAADVPTEVGRMVDTMIARDRERRPGSLADVARVFAVAAGVTAPTIAPPKQRNRSGAAAGVVSERVSESERDPTQGSFESDSDARPKASLRNWGFVALGVGSLVALGVFATRSPAPLRGDLATGAPAGAPLNTAEAAAISVEPAPASAAATSTANATATAVEPEASATVSSSARAGKRKTPRRAASALYDDPPELDF